VLASQANQPVVAVFLSDKPAVLAVPAFGQPLLSASPRKSPSSAGASSGRASLGSSCRSPLPRYIPVSASSPRPKTFGGDSLSPSNVLSEFRSSVGKEPDNVKISSPVMVLGVSGSGKKEGTRPNIGSPRKISASPTERMHSRVVTNSPRSVPTTTTHHTLLQATVLAATLPESDPKHQIQGSPPVRDWNIFEKSFDLRDNAAAAASLAQVALATQVPQVAVAGISKISVHVKSKEPSPDRNQSPVSQIQQSARDVQSSRHNQKQRNRQVSARRNPASTMSTERGLVDTVVPSVADLVATFENAAIDHGRLRTDPSPVVVQKTSPASRSFATQNDAMQKLSPRSAAVSSASLYSDLRSASKAAVKSGSSASVLQLYPENAVWNQDSSTVLREFYADCTVHGVTALDAPSSSPKSKHAVKPPVRTPLKTSSADHARTPVVSAPSVSFWPTALD
jgi:hypothetical protein